MSAAYPLEHQPLSAARSRSIGSTDVTPITSNPTSRDTALIRDRRSLTDQTYEPFNVDVNGIFWSKTAGPPPSLVESLQTLFSRTIRMPYFGLSVTMGCGSTLWPDAMRIRQSRAIVARTRMPSIHANDSPIQTLGPPPNGK